NGRRWRPYSESITASTLGPPIPLSVTQHISIAIVRVLDTESSHCTPLLSHTRRDAAVPCESQAPQLTEKTTGLVTGKKSSSASSATGQLRQIARRPRSTAANLVPTTAVSLPVCSSIMGSQYGLRAASPKFHLRLLTRALNAALRRIERLPGFGERVAE